MNSMSKLTFPVAMPSRWSKLAVTYEVSIQFVGLFEANSNIDNVEAALNEITKEKINCTVDIVPVFIGDLPTTTSLGVAGGEKLKEHGVQITAFGNSSQCNYKFMYGGDLFGSAGEYGGILDPANSSEIINIYDTQEMRDYFKVIKSWNEAGYLPAGQLTDTTTIQEYFNQQKIFGTTTAYTVNQIASWQTAGFETGIVRISDPVISTASVTEFMLGIAANCERPDKAMDLINLIYSDPEVANLIQYGIEGTDYKVLEGTENVITYDGTSNADHNSYFASFVHFGNPLDLKIVSPLTDSYYDDVQAFEKDAHKSTAFGYTFDSTNFGAESGAISSVLQEKLPMLNAGEVADVDAAVDDLVASLKSAGIDDVIAANQEQLNTYLGK